MIDGIEGSGKSTVIEAWKKYLTNQANTIFDLKEYWKTRGVYPDYQELHSYDFIFSAEPTYLGIGKAIREEIIRRGTDYPERAIAESYSLDRLILYKKIIIPAIKDNKCVIQDRGIATSLCYQAISKNLSVKFLTELPGNALALQNRPDHLIIMKMSPEIALERLKKRYEKQDNVIFDRINFQKKAAARYASSDYQKLFLDRGTKIHYLSADAEIGIMNKEAVALLKKILTAE